MAATAGFRLRVEPLSASHLALSPTAQAACSPLPENFLQSLLVQSWLSRFDQWLPDRLNARLTRVLSLIESCSDSADRLETLALMRCGNRRHSCWHLDLLPLLSPRHFSRQQGLRLLIQQALSDDIARSRSWLVRCDPADRPQLDVLREMGFQPLRHGRLWTPPEQITTAPDGAVTATPPRGLGWGPLSDDTARQLLTLEQASMTPQHRQILDRQYGDLLDLRGGGSTVLTAQREQSQQVIAGLIRRPWGIDAPALELVRGPAWDERIGDALPAALVTLQLQQTAPCLVVAEDDQQIASVLEGQGWQPGPLELMLGRSLWRRAPQRSLAGIRPLESMLGRLQPQHPPLPTPSLAPRR